MGGKQSDEFQNSKKIVGVVKKERRKTSEGDPRAISIEKITSILVEKCMVSARNATSNGFRWREIKRERKLRNAIGLQGFFRDVSQ